VNGLYLVAIGSLPEKALDWIESAADEWFPFPIRRLPALAIPEGAYDAKRGQYQSVEIMKKLAQHAPLDASRVLGVTDVDLAIPMLSFLFGQAQFDGPIAVVSLCRLHQEFYGLPPQESLLRERTVKEVLHELGHTFGLVHCSDPKCAMSLATHIELVDSKAEQYCARCGLQLVHRFASREEKV
jgi:archaemetzincin